MMPQYSVANYASYDCLKGNYMTFLTHLMSGETPKSIEKALFRDKGKRAMDEGMKA